MMEEGKKINFYRLGLENGRRYRMELTDEYRLTGTGGGVPVSASNLASYCESQEGCLINFNFSSFG